MNLLNKLTLIFLNDGDLEEITKLDIEDEYSSLTKVKYGYLELSEEVPYF